MLSAAGSCEVSTTIALVCGAQSSMPVRLGHWQSQTANVCSKTTGQWSDRAAMSSCIFITRSNELLARLGIEDLDRILKEWRLRWYGHEERSNGAVKTAFDVQIENVGLGSPRWLSSWQRGFAESGGYGLSICMIDIPGDMVWELPCVQQACYLEGDPLTSMLPLYLQVNQKADDDDNDILNWTRQISVYRIWI